MSVFDNEEDMLHRNRKLKYLEIKRYEFFKEQSDTE
jgi:hypothetical protein